MASKEDKGLLETKVLFLKDPWTDSLTYKLTYSKLKHKFSSLKSARDI